MRLRGFLKKITFGSLPLLRGSFPYFGYTVYFPLGSYIFERACAEGFYEKDVTNLILSLVGPETTYFDVGANIGLLSVPVLATYPSVKIVSIEASPSTFSYLMRTHARALRRDNWTVVGVAVGATSSQSDFWVCDAAQGAFDGLRDTGRGGRKVAMRVPVVMLDEIWRDLRCPRVSLIKMDIEGGEFHAIQGAKDIIARDRPIFIIEWYDGNLKAYNIEPDSLLQLCIEIGYEVYAVPSLTRIARKAVLKLAMAVTATFVLVPVDT